LVLEKGKIVEQGKHEQLVANDGPYKKLFDAQFNN
jgi:ABC-type multidrug transport system fused ATPase/permease subunit